MEGGEGARRKVEYRRGAVGWATGASQIADRVESVRPGPRRANDIEGADIRGRVPPPPLVVLQKHPSGKTRIPVSDAERVGAAGWETGGKKRDGRNGKEVREEELKGKRQKNGWNKRK